MSTILDALRKLQREREGKDSQRDIRRAVAQPSARRSRRALRALAVVAVLLAGAGAGAWFMIPEEGAALAARWLPLESWLGAAEPEASAPAETAEVPASRAARRAAPPPTARQVPAPAQPAPVPPRPVARADVPPPAPPPPAEPVQPLPRPPVAEPVVEHAAASAEGSPPPAVVPVPVPAPESAPPAPPTPARAEKPLANERAKREAAPLVAEQTRPRAPAKSAPRAEEAPPPRAAPAAEQAPASTAPHGDEIPEIVLRSVRWHPLAARRVVSLELPQIGPLELHEGDIAGGVLLLSIEPGGIEVQVGSARKRISLHP